MPKQVRRRHSARKSSIRWMIAAIALFSAASCIAPVLYASDCSRWIAEYRQGILQQRAARRLRAAKYRLTHLTEPGAPVHHYPRRHPMGPLEALRRFQIDCGDLDTPEMLPKLASAPLLATPLPAEFPPLPPPDLPLAPLTEVAEAVPPLADVPTTITPAESVPVPGPVPEPASGLLVCTGALISYWILRRPSAVRIAA